MMSLVDRMTRPEWDFTGFTSTKDARIDFASKVNKLWNESRSEVTLEGMNRLETKAKSEGRNWRRFVLVSELAIDSDEGTLADYEKMAYILMGIAEDKRNPEHEVLFDAVDDYRKGWTDFQGNQRDTETFGKLIQYEKFIEAISDYGKAYTDLFSKAGIE